MLRKALILAAFAASPALAQDVVDGPGPNLVIEVAGVANGTVVIDMADHKAPKHVAQIVELAKSGAYDGVVFHRVIDGFMAQTGDVSNGKAGGDLSMAGTGGSTLPDLRPSSRTSPLRAVSWAWPGPQTRIRPTASSSSCSIRVIS